MRIFHRALEAKVAEIRQLYEDYDTNPHNYTSGTMEVVRHDRYGDLLSAPYLKMELKLKDEVLGLENIGHGAYSVAYALNDKTVIKIAEREDNSYETFVDFVEAEGHKYSCFPKIYFRQIWSDKRVYVMERLQQPGFNIMNSLAAIAESAMSEEMQDNPFFNIPTDFLKGMRALNRFYRENSNAKELHLDLHGGNVALRLNGQPVIIDPFS